MEPVTAIVISIALGAAAKAGEAVVSELVGDAYAALKDLIKSRYPKVSLDQLEQAPESAKRRAVIEEDLANSGAAQDPELASAARKLGELIQQHRPDVARQNHRAGTRRPRRQCLGHTLPALCP